MKKKGIIAGSIVALGLILALLGWLNGIPAAQASGASVIIRGIPQVRQQYGLSCEYAAASAVTQFWGNKITENTFIREIPQSPNPHLGFRGNIYGSGGGINNYGVYAEALVPALANHGFYGAVFYGGVSRLKAEMQAGHPVIVWLTTGRYTPRPVYTRTYAGETFKLVPDEHAVVAYGYDNTGLRVLDVGNGQYYLTPWDAFLTRWNYFDEMGLVILPR